MQTTDILLSAIRESLIPEFRQIIQEEIHSKLSQDLKEKYLSPDAVCEMFQPKISRGTLFNWDRDDRINSYLIGGRRLYKYSEVIEAIERLKKYSRNNNN
jgi:hypothetical protein